MSAQNNSDGEMNVRSHYALLEEHRVWEEAQFLPCELALEVPIPSFTVGDLLRLEQGIVIETEWKQDGDVPLKLNGHLIGWAAFEVVGEQLAARLTDLA